MIYVIEWILTFLAVWGLNYLFIWLFTKKTSLVISSLLTFVFTIFTAFIVAPYVLSFSNPSIYYLPVAIGFLIYNLKKASHI